MANINLRGMGVALITPFKEDESVDYEALGRLVDYQVQNGTDYLVVLGTTAETPTLTEEEKKNITHFVVTRETPTLTEEEKKNITHFVVTRVRGRVPIVLGVSGNCTRAVVEKLRTDDFEGIDAILSVVPYYNKPSQEGIYQHYKAIAEATKLPLVLYNVPGRTGVNMTAETTLLRRRWYYFSARYVGGDWRDIGYRERFPARVQPYGPPGVGGRLRQRAYDPPQFYGVVQPFVRGWQSGGCEEYVEHDGLHRE